MISGLNFTAIDFETANNYRRSACAVGLAKVRDGEIVETRYWLIKPDPLEVGFYQHRVHGLSLDLLMDQPTFPELWHEIGPYLKNETLAAHNSSFDMGVLNHLNKYYAFAPSVHFSGFCTHRAAKYHWRGEQSHALGVLCARLGIELHHHHAESDAIACAKIGIEISRQRAANRLSQIEFGTTS